MTKFKGLLSRRLTSDAMQEEETAPDARSSVTRNQVYTNYATESNLNRESRSVSTSSGKSHKFTLSKEPEREREKERERQRERERRS